MLNFVEEFQKARVNQEPYKVFKSVFDISQNMGELLEFTKNSPYGKYRDQAETVHIKEALYPDMMPVDNIHNFFNLMKASYGQDYHDRNSFTMLISEREISTYSGITGVPSHFDPQDNIHWNCLGSSLWLLNGTDKLILEPGDIIYIKSGTTHEVTTLAPRVAIIFSI